VLSEGKAPTQAPTPARVPFDVLGKSLPTAVVYTIGLWAAGTEDRMRP
jgi:hypothetical protein